MYSNQLLAALSAEDLRRLQPEIRQVPLLQGQVIYEPKAKLDCVLFPGSSIVTLMNLMENGSSAETAMIGPEGVVGVSLFLGVASANSHAIVQTDGIGYRMRAEVIRREIQMGSHLQSLALRYTQALMTQMTQTAVCNRFHELEQRMCRWLLLTMDRIHCNELFVTHELAASLLGVRREAVSETAKRLQDAGLIKCGRGRISILDRAKLEANVCECYAVVEREYARLVPQPEQLHFNSGYVSGQGVPSRQQAGRNLPGEFARAQLSS